MGENNDIVSKCWIVFRHGIVAKLTSAAEFLAAEDIAIYSRAYLFNVGYRMVQCFLQKIDAGAYLRSFIFNTEVILKGIP